MTDLEGNELEVGTIYVFPNGSNQIVLVKYSHETEKSYVFKWIRIEHALGVKARVYSCDRLVPKRGYINTALCFKATEAILQRHVGDKE